MPAADSRGPPDLSSTMTIRRHLLSLLSLSLVLVGGFAGLVCPDKLVCVDDPSDDCNPAKGGADCMGICVSG